MIKFRLFLYWKSSENSCFLKSETASPKMDPCIFAAVLNAQIPSGLSGRLIRFCSSKSKKRKPYRRKLGLTWKKKIWLLTFCFWSLCSTQSHLSWKAMEAAQANPAGFMQRFLFHTCAWCRLQYSEVYPEIGLFFYSIQYLLYYQPPVSFSKRHCVEKKEQRETESASPLKRPRSFWSRLPDCFRHICSDHRSRIIRLSL